MHHENMRVLYPEDKLMVLCECDGALYDTRILAVNVLRAFDREHGTTFFRNLSVDQVQMPLTDIDDLLSKLLVPIGISTEITGWFSKHLWDMENLWSAHRPLANVMKVLKGLQIQKQTHIGLSTTREGRTDCEFISSINTLGSAVGMCCDHTTVFLDDEAGNKTSGHKIVQACRHFQNKGYRLIAVIDNRHKAEPEHIFCIDRSLEVMHLQGRAVREMMRMDINPRMLARTDFRLWDLLNTKARNEIAPSCACAGYDSRTVFQQAVA
jgi:hypothetical protein